MIIYLKLEQLKNNIDYSYVWQRVHSSRSRLLVTCSLLLTIIKFTIIKNQIKLFCSLYCTDSNQITKFY